MSLLLIFLRGIMMLGIKNGQSQTLFDFLGFLMTIY